MRRFYKIHQRWVVRATYRYGFTTVPADITRATALIVAAQLLEVEDSVVAIPSGGDLNIVSVSDKAKRYREEAERIIDRYRDWRLVQT